MHAIIELTDHDGNLIEPGWLARADAVHRQLRPHLPADYAARMREIFAGGGRMAVAARGEKVLGLAVWRHSHKTFATELYVDDLVTDEAQRSTGVGRALLALCERRARELGCETLSLDSGTQRQQAHKFYFRESMVVSSFHFVKPLR
jgi:GNAT superfamily N-acetyltransferase